MPLGRRAEDRYGAPYLTLHRADLHAGLRAAAESLAPVTLRPGFDVSAADTQGSDVLVRSTEGSEAKGVALVGADGLWSTLRPLIAPAASLRFTGATAWRTLLPRAELPAPFNASEVGLWLGPRAHLVHYPVRGGSDLNVVAVIEGGAALQGWNQTGSAETLLAAFTRWTKDSKSLLERATSWRSWSLYRLTGLRRFSEGRIALLGDAAHPVLPYLAQGAALAIEDAVTLADTIAACPGDPALAFPVTRRSAGRAPPASSACRGASAGSITSADPCGSRAILCSNGGAEKRPSPISTGSTARRRRRSAEAEWLWLELFHLFEVLLDRRQRIRRELLQRVVIAPLGIFVEEVRQPFRAP